MRIIQLQAENIKGLVAVDITPESELVILSGENGAGKSSVLDAIYWAIAGGKNIQDKPIRDGETKAFIKLDLGELVIERKFTPSGTTLTVSSENGAVFKKPQEMLDALCGAITFDPMAFAEMKPAAQVETLKSLIDLDVDFDEIERQNEVDYARRTDVNRTVKELEVKVKAQKAVLEGKEIPAEKLVVSELANELNDLRENQDAKAAISNRIEIQKDYISSAKSRIAELQAELEKEELELASLQTDLTSAPEITDEQIAAARERLDTAEALNTLYDHAGFLKKNEAELEAKRTESNAFTESMAARTKSVEDAIAAAKMPVEGLSFTKDGILFEGIPFAQCNTGTKIRVSTAVAMATNPELRVIRVERGAWLDKNNMAALREMAEKHDFQIWIERIADEPMAIQIKDGRVVESEPVDERELVAA